MVRVHIKRPSPIALIAQAHKQLFITMCTHISDCLSISPDRTAAPHVLKDTCQRFAKHTNRLFAEEAEAALDLLDLGDEGEGVNSAHNINLKEPQS